MEIATAISPDEMCWCLVEEVRPAPDFSGLHRYQEVTVVRNDRLTTWATDLGEASNFKGQQFRIPGGVRLTSGKGLLLHTVGELRDMADAVRNLPPPEREPRDLVGDYYKMMERRAKYAKRY